MADAQLQITIKARNQAKAEFDKLDKQVKGLQGQAGVKGLNKTLGDLDSKFKSVTGVSLGFATAAGAAGAAVSGLIKFVSDAVNETVAYATEIDNMSRLLGISAEDTSRLVQASDDLFISQEKLTGALQAASRKGIDVSIEGLKGLSEQYLALNPGVDRAKFLMDNFGRSGSDMGKLMEKGADGIDAATAAIADNMIITQKSMTDIMNYKRSVDNLNDSWQGVKYTVGSTVIPQLDLLFRVMTKGKDDVEKHAQAVNKLQMQLDRAASAAAIGNKSAKAAMEDLQKQLDTLNDEFYNTDDAADTTTSAINDLGVSASDVSQYFGQLTTSIMFNKLAANMDFEAAMELGRAMGLVDENTVWLSGKLDTLTEKYDTNKNGVMEVTEMTKEYYEEVALLKGLVESVNDKTVVIRVRGEIDNSAREAASLTGQGRNAYIGLAASNRAVGGPVTGGTPYIVGEVGPELFVPNTSGSIVPHNQLAGSTVVNFYYSPAISLTDRTEAETRLVPIIRKALARA